MLLSIFQHKWWEVGCKTSLSFVCITFVSPGNLDICLCWFGGVVRVYCTPVVKLMKMFSSFTHVLPICMCCLKLSWPPQDYSHTRHTQPYSQSLHILFLVRKINWRFWSLQGKNSHISLGPYFSGIIAAILNNVGSQFGISVSNRVCVARITTKDGE